MAKQKSTTKPFDFAKLVKGRSLLEAEFAEHDALQQRLLDIMTAIAEELTVSELHEMAARWERHPQAWLAAA